MKNFQAIARECEAYLDGFRPFTKAMEFKYYHLHRAVADAEILAQSELFRDDESEKLRLAVMLHDMGRFEQLRRHGTFDDRASEDHALISCEIAKERGWTEDEDVLAAVRCHNHPRTPGGMSALRRKLVLGTKDCDRLDILLSLQSLYDEVGLREISRMFRIEPEPPPSPVVCRTVLSRQIVDFRLLASASDCMIMQIGWLLTGFHYATTCRLAVNRGYIEYRRKALKEISDSPYIDEVCDIASLSNFYRGIAGVMAKMVMADGSYQPEERTLVDRTFRKFARNDTEYLACMSAFDGALETERDLDYYLALCREKGGPEDFKVVTSVAEELMFADGVCHPKEESVLERILAALA